MKHIHKIEKNMSQAFCISLCIGIMLTLAVAGCGRDKERNKADVQSETQKKEQSVAAKPQDEKTVKSSADGDFSGTIIFATIDNGEQIVESPNEISYSNPHSGHEQPPFLPLIFSSSGKGAAYQAKKGNMLYVVHNGKAGKEYQSIGPMIISPDGKRIAYVVHINGKWTMVVDGHEDGKSDMVGEPVFSPDSRHIAYESQAGDKWQIVIDGRRTGPSEEQLIKPVFSGDSAKILYIERNKDDNKKLVISDLILNKQHVKNDNFGHAVVNEDMTRIAVIIENEGKKMITDFSFAKPESVRKWPLYDDISYLNFGKDGVSISYVATKGDTRFFVMNRKEERISDGYPGGMPVIRPDSKGAGIIMAVDSGSFFHQAFYNDGAKSKKYDEANFLTYSKDGGQYAYAARKGEKWFVVVNGKEGPAFDRVVTPVFSPDGKKIVYRVRRDGKRFVVVADINGKTINQHPAYEQVFQPVFTSDGKSVAYGVKDGRKLIWKVEKLGE